ncbi:patatin family protein [Vibrio europaeus]|uniref:Patatin family protein n=1 Tax=Vibrio europaeus TaxID=300876 RepID=A0AAE7AWQ8_9VIBR|nr:patatin family protein [Vibrio europaeus]MDC5806930.1 patatin family protein [Vibrio europaeus]MDC5809525.1 patatin family protein [Vibrio europaeus]MDC5821578.1 patatin family protein [Vibrio europaeus]MDC5827455.1 patatin family protein [Vibrio europaeus]MDC5830299.1 patatin family protein [Vibrio europaeus]
MKAIVVEGGAMRGIFAAGVLDSFIENGYQPFDFAIGVSAGASNLVGYLAQQQNRSYQVITTLATNSEFFNPKRFIKGGNLVDVKWLVSESEKQFPLDREQLFSSTPLVATTTNIETGKADYYQVTRDNLHLALEATSALPIAYKQTPCFSGGCYADGGVADSIPVMEAYRRGAKEITVVLSHPLSYEMPQTRASWLLKRLLAKYPMIGKAMANRATSYNKSLEFIRRPPKDVTIRVIAPPVDFAVKRLTMKKELLDKGYQMGVTEGDKHLASLDGVYGLTEENCHFCL